MHEFINEKISVVTVYDRIKGTVIPKRIKWQGRIYDITKLSYYKPERVGRNIVHTFHVSNEAMDFKLRLDSYTLHWTLIEVTDGNS
ncbi:hypothetical protein A2767_02700 [Candidatus Roizmanbacteria bacterium RIFCSPHIGHO2_01_FULL_35_10]|uniref:Uncharacterized protein n=1 Tax=Candidatus Roizmanbacteria bacterium RIFCSPLOWO2_01_FULL_35_13 TaxID=1802055 RepID=A0A1F7IF27_9BACT|nr:MAG: hypothetical protein A2767_02700 [Candidatus Roizmanbacteria bacterium RIFCSPHIGHO2_01_FULL_35_10]OGK41954.1 MAG: hypothetical protein A3A74_04625 [Candidatus Roizmanbacteria bacterium RIFCSPLOWO2_01_FULL_35_13]